MDGVTVRGVKQEASSDRTRVQRLRFHVSRWARASAMSIG